MRNGQPLSETGKELSVSRAGTYRVIVTNEGGCTAYAEVIIRESQTELPIDITAPSSVDLGAEIHVVNISQIKADRLNGTSLSGQLSRARVTRGLSSQ